MPRPLLKQAQFHRIVGVPGALKLVLALLVMKQARVAELAEVAGIRAARASQIVQSLRALDVVQTAAEGGRFTFYRLAPEWRRDVEAIRKSIADEEVPAQVK